MVIFFNGAQDTSAGIVYDPQVNLLEQTRTIAFSSLADFTVSADDITIVFPGSDEAEVPNGMKEILTRHHPSAHIWIKLYTMHGRPGEVYSFTMDRDTGGIDSRYETPASGPSETQVIGFVHNSRSIPVYEYETVSSRWRDITISKVNGCIGILIFGHNMITGTHIYPEEIQTMLWYVEDAINRAKEEHGGYSVQRIVLMYPGSEVIYKTDNISKVYTTRERDAELAEIMNCFEVGLPGIPVQLIEYERNIACVYNYFWTAHRDPRSIEELRLGCLGPGGVGFGGFATNRMRTIELLPS